MWLRGAFRWMNWDPDMLILPMIMFQVSTLHLSTMNFICHIVVYLSNLWSFSQSVLVFTILNNFVSTTALDITLFIAFPYLLWTNKIVQSPIPILERPTAYFFPLKEPSTYSFSLLPDITSGCAERTWDCQLPARGRAWEGQGLERAWTSVP